MSDDVTSVLLAITVVLAPIWIVLHYVSKMRGNRRSNTQDDAAYAQLTQTAARMEQRMATLERILDTEVPNWRQYEAMGARDHGTV
jgi:phage shock protein B